MNFFDCNAFIGLPVRRGLYPPVPGAEDILSEMDFCGVERALVWHIAQFDASPQTGNALLAQAIQASTKTFFGSAVLNEFRLTPPVP